MMSPDLIAFLKAWYEWATNGAPDGEPFRRRNGICYNAYIFFERLGKPAGKDLFVALGSDFPFGESDYSQRWHARTQHECPKRLAWVRERLIEAGELRNCDDCDFSTTDKDVTVCPDRACRGSVA